jgi:hypothetical protein
MLRPVWRSMARSGRPITLLAAIVFAPLLAGCTGNGDDQAKLGQQAQAALTRWADAVGVATGRSPVVIVGDRTGQIGDWELAVGDNNKLALMSGVVEADASLPPETPPNGEVRWRDGTTAPVPLISAPQAVAAIRAETSQPCSECIPLRITASRLTTGTIETGRGSATVPVWEFTVDGTAVRVTRVAIADPVTVVLPPWDPNDAPVGIAIESASGTVGGHELTVNFVGGPLPDGQTCGEDYSAESVESDLAVVVIVTPHGGPACGTLVGTLRTATVELAHPLGDRTVLEVQQGLPVPVVLTP